MTSLGIHRRSQTCELTPRGQQGRQHAHAADTGIRVREENSQCNYQAVDAQRFPERKTHDWNAAITPTAPGFVAQGGRF